MNEELKKRIRHLLPRTLKPHRVLSGPLRGARIITSWHDYPAAILGSAERPLLRWFEKNVRSGETWLDIGAHYGYTAIALARLVGPSGRVYAFEPMIASAGCISRARCLNRVNQLTVFAAALGNCADVESGSLQVTRGMLDSTLSSSSGFSEHFIVSSLDWLWPRICGSNQQIHGVKIDVQGMEISVLEGMISLARQFSPKLVIEIHGGVSRSRFLAAVSAAGYKPQGSPLEPLPGESAPLYADDRSYLFAAEESQQAALKPV